MGSLPERDMAPNIDSALGTADMANEQRGLLELIDKLQFAQLDNVKLPQIVVVGDQSAGKSSVLEAITGTPFPRDAGACTRFATEIRLRRSNEPSLNVSIIPDKNKTFKEQERLKQFGGAVDVDMSFESLMRSAVDLIAPKNIPGRFAARDILVVEKRGPDMPLLTLVDLPGLVKNANNDQSMDDIKTIETLCDRYMKSSRTIILAVVGGNTDYVQAPILTKARHFDPSGGRTIGVLTKPDLCESIGLEDKFIELVQNRDKQNYFKLGWYVLLNPGPRDQGQPWPSARERRQREEEFFGRGKWRALPSSMCGANALKQKLSVQLQRHIGRHVKTLRKQIQTALDDCDTELKSMGTGKDTVEEMRIELVELFSASKELVIPAVYGFYKNPPRKNFFRATADPRGTPAQNLRARAIEENEKFSHRIRQNGRKFGFSSSTAPGTADGVTISESSKREFVGREVEMLLRQIRGSEFPMDPKPRAVYMLFQSYSENWPKLAQEHKDNLGVVCNEFLSEVIDFAWPQRMREPLRYQFLDVQMKKLMSDAQQELEHLTQDMNLEIQPYDPEYEERLRKWQIESSKDGATYTEAQEVCEKMLIFYELAAKTFIRNTITQVVERHLLQGMYSIFNSVEILSMPNETVEAIAAENKETRDRRMTLKTQKTAIEEARDICASLAMRKELRMYADEDRDLEDNSSDSDEDKPRQTTTRKPVNNTTTSSNTIPSRETNRSTRSRDEREERYERPAARTQPSAAESLATNGNHGYSSQQTPAQAPPPPPQAQAPAPHRVERAEPPRTNTSNSEWEEEYYRAPSQQGAPAQAPPPPPRPQKLRPEEAAASDAYSHRSASSVSEQQHVNGYGSYHDQSEYAPSSTRRATAKKLFGRG
ncbi:Putative dynamin stalk domain, GTPase effector domain-containing protein [Colletotrichum destructivum]|uniref:Dynamin stalk domain, GTPase effector domain-containing protein n=1 Tax=Colletotrichum destructivum TaxID=34406 RepID=A0AAX4IM31_9PEZI|nr:Putative dynamin stalk domain, GTPase effector domain-containing protein [Colletotrichum destructivum]